MKNKFSKIGLGVSELDWAFISEIFESYKFILI